MLFFHQSGTEIEVQASEDSRIMVLSGEPIGEPVASYGPFVMNTQNELVEAIEDFNSGKFGVLN
ncbi:MAG: redox-sensitive bicupin YhaK (pirin superfamily) [Sphingobacteriales bacterium]|jgi:redox-sensitive bicupin YhaK (pirin superfamily)